jgi:hypothetical protein
VRYFFLTYFLHSVTSTRVHSALMKKQVHELRETTLAEFTAYCDRILRNEITMVVNTHQRQQVWQPVSQWLASLLIAGRLTG